ncbi:MAG: glycosyltransferase [Salinivirgaceae bacterium]
MKLSVIIVNYNVLHFLRQCLRSVENAKRNIAVEVFVVDNNSVDGSVAMVRNEFPWVKLIVNKDNVGFSKANNQAIHQAKGDFVLLLNPDTVVEEETFTRIVGFMESHPDAGGLGVKMIDGNGKFLPESKRGLPTPMVAFYKIVGLSSLFPHSKRFGKYHLKYLDNNKIHQVDVLSGAFFLLRKEVVDKIGGLDETFFMYGEDIDLSYRITKAGYKNYYYPDTTIIHYKGESTKKDSINYVVVFFNAMIIFARKHFAKKYALFFSNLIRLAIMLSAGMAIFKRLVARVVLPIVDFFVLWVGFLFISPLWENYRFGPEDWFPDYYLTTVVPFYALLWVVAIVYSGGYDKPLKVINVLKGVAWGFLVLLIIYALLPETLRFSRMMLLFGSVWGVIALSLLRFMYFKSGFRSLTPEKRSATLVVGDQSDLEQVERIATNFGDVKHIVGFVLPTDDQSDKALGNISNINEVVRINGVNEIIFSSQSLASKDIIRLMIRLGEPGLKFKIASQDGISVIGSSTIHSLDDVYSVEVNAINRPSNQRFKRTFDVLLAFAFLILSPVLAFTVKNKTGFVRNSIAVLLGRFSWVGFAKTTRLHELPPIRKGIVNTAMLQKRQNLSDDILQRINVIYAKDYRLINDFAIVFRLWKHLGN